MNLHIKNKETIKSLLGKDYIMGRHISDATRLIYEFKDNNIKIYAADSLMGSYTLLPARFKVLQDYVNK